MIVLPLSMPGNELWNLVDAGGDALANCLIDENRRSGGDIERIGRSEHRNPDPEFRAVHPLRREPVLLRAKRNRDIAGQVDFEMELLGMRRRGKNLEAALLKPCKRLVRSRLDDRHGEHRPRRGADDIRVVDVGRAVTDYHSRDLCRVSRAEDRTEIARLFNRLGDDDERVLG